MEGSEEANPQRQEADERLPATGGVGHGVWLLTGMEFLSGVMGTYRITQG